MNSVAIQTYIRKGNENKLKNWYTNENNINNFVAILNEYFA